MAFTRATKRSARLRMALDGPSGSGKTYTGLTFAFALAGAKGRVAVIDTERGSASKYADVFPAFDTLELSTFSPQLYTQAIAEAEAAGYDVLLIDSLSHAWEGEGGALDMVDRAASRNQGNSFTAWKDVTPVHRKMVDAILQSKCHIITTMRSKMEYILEEQTRNGRTVQVTRKVGMAPIQRAGMEYEFDVVCDLDIHHKLIVSKTRCPAIDEADELKPTGAWMRPVIAWLTGDPAPIAPPPAGTTVAPPSMAGATNGAPAHATPGASDAEFGAMKSASAGLPPAAPPAPARGLTAAGAAANVAARAAAELTAEDLRAAPRPWTAEQTIAALQHSAPLLAGEGQPSGLFGAAIDIMEHVGVNERKLFLQQTFGTDSSKSLTNGQKWAIVRWLKPGKAEGERSPWTAGNPHWRAEFDGVVRRELEPTPF
jgi:hypothetical protein